MADHGKACPAAPDPTSVVTVADASRELAISQRHFRRLIAAGQVRVVRFGRAVRIPRGEVERLANNGCRHSPARRPIAHNSMISIKS